MTLFGMTEGLALGVICATLTFTLQGSHFLNPIRGYMSAMTLKSSKWRTPYAVALLEANMRHVFVFQLQGTLFFGNSSQLTREIKRILASYRDFTAEIWIAILDFTLVTSIDSSAADIISKITAICRERGVKLCYCRGSNSGFPTMFPLTEKIISLGECRVDVSQDEDVAICDDLDSSLIWAEETILRKLTTPHNEASLRIEVFQESRKHLWQLYTLCPDEPIDELMKYFNAECVRKGQNIWRQGDVSDKAVLVVSGQLLSILEEEDGTVETVSEGHLIGEYGLIHGQHRLSSLVAATNSELLVLEELMYARMLQESPRLAFTLANICVGYLGRRVQFVSNRIWESRCIPI